MRAPLVDTANGARIMMGNGHEGHHGEVAMAESNRDRATRGGWGLGAVAGVGDPPYASTKRHALSGDGTLRVYADDGVTVLREERLQLTDAGYVPLGTARAPTPANPQPAPGQVWVPPVGDIMACTVACDGTLTVRDVDPTPRGTFVHFVEGGYATDDLMAGAKRGWRCVGVATERGRVMVGDGYQTGGIGDRPLAVAAIGAGDSVLLRASHGWEQWTNASGLTDGGSTLRRTHYAPARVGERYRWRAASDTYVIDVDARGRLTAKCGGSPVPLASMIGMTPDGRAEVEWWERLDPSTATAAPARVPQVATGSVEDLRRLLAERLSVHTEDVDVRRLDAGTVEVGVRWFSAHSTQEALDELSAEGRLPLGCRFVARGAPESDADLRARIVVAHRHGRRFSAVALRLAAEEIAAGSIGGKSPHEIHVALRTVCDARVDAWTSFAAEWSPAFRDCNPLTATGAALDRLAPLWSIERRVGATARETGDGRMAVSGRAGATVDYTFSTVVSVEGFDIASRAFTRIHDAQPKPTPADPARAHRDEVRRAIDKAIAADKGQPFATARAAALHAWAETLTSHDTVADVAAVHAGLLRYEALRGSRREPSLAALDVSVPETARAMYERERGGKRVETVTPREEPTRPTGGATLNGWQTAAHFWERWSR